MIDYFDKLKKIFFLLLACSQIPFAVCENAEIRVEKQGGVSINFSTGIISNLAGTPIEILLDDSLLGDPIDIYYPCTLLNCYVFVFKKENTVFKIAANSEVRFFEEIESKKNPYNNFIALGYYAFEKSDGSKKNMFKQSFGTPFDFLNNINPERYISIAEIEKQIGLVFDIIDKGGFLSPFYDYYCKIDDKVLFIMGSPGNTKEESYFMGGWSFFDDY